jgi:hypothetical protein
MDHEGHQPFSTKLSSGSGFLPLSLGGFPLGAANLLNGSGRPSPHVRRSCDLSSSLTNSSAHSRASVISGISESQGLR